MTGDYKPVPDDLLTVLERLVDAAEGVIAWYELRAFDPIEDDFRRAIYGLSDVVSRASAYLERTP